MNDASHEIKKMWAIFALCRDSVIELRALRPAGTGQSRPVQTKHFRVNDYAGSIARCKEAVENVALELNSQGYNVYATMNPIRPDFSGPGAAKDSDILYRHLLLIDIDRKGDTSVPANQEELDAARALARKIRAEMTERGFREPIVVMSGNGYHLYYVLDAWTNDTEATELVRKTVVKLAAQFDNDIVGVDKTVYNASRITKVPGTIMRKGAETEDRPYRMAVVCDEL